MKFKRVDSDTLMDVVRFNEVVVDAYNDGVAEKELEADIDTARSIIPAGTGALRDFSYISTEIPQFISDNCVGCMECVVECPDTAILGKVIGKSRLEEELSREADPELRENLKKQFAVTAKYYKNPEKKGREGGLFGIFIDPTKCKGCAECVEVCGDRNALKMIRKNSKNLTLYKDCFAFFRGLPETPSKYINEKVLADMMLKGDSILYLGGAASCMGCGEVTAIRMMLAATGFIHGPDSAGIVASTGCNTVYGSTYPYNPYLVPWMNSLFENSAAVAVGLRMRWNQIGCSDKKIWVLGGDGAILDIGFQALSRMLMTGLNINVLVLDTQVYSNTGGQLSTSSYKGQEAKMAAFGSEMKGKTERRKELGPICMMHPDIYVAQTCCAYINHFYRSIIGANEFEGPSVVICYTTCQPEHGVADNLSAHQARLAVNSRAFPLFIYDPRNGSKIKDRLDLQGNPARSEDWYVHPRTGETIDFIHFAGTEGRFAKHFDKGGNPSEMLLAAQDDRLNNWRLLQQLAGIR
ncbi:MAG: thiamine pyrophosphate-dependent enzyme [Fidelibacterota bacterium]